MSKNKIIFETLIKEISDKHNLTEEEISIAVNRNSGYIAQLRSRQKKGEDIPGKFIDLLRLHFAIPNKDEEIIALKAAVKVIMLELAQLISCDGKQSPTAIYLNLEKMTKQLTEQLVNES